MTKQTRLARQYDQLAEVLSWYSLDETVKQAKDEVGKLLEAQRDELVRANVEYEKAQAEVSRTKDNLADVAAYVGKLERLLR